ncbi:hypothetical protein [Oceanobacillus damuensis]|uniref:hypothetical protein n=1 Tax=Oceanobacillus damuensis TaxID=937928 RepID=UPI0008366649|nr:hypothetical protein [Oceanobacillus damuensis]
MKKKKFKVLSKINLFIDDFSLLIGMWLISFGVFKIYVPAGYIVSGIFFIIFAFFYVQTKEGDDG